MAKSKYFDKTHRQMDCAKRDCSDVGTRLKAIGGQIHWLCEDHFQQFQERDV